jgi:hypothetical protein
LVSERWGYGLCSSGSLRFFFPSFALILSPVSRHY